MAALQWTGNAQFQSGTLGSSYTAGGLSLVLTAGHGARFPASGDFWVRVQTSESDDSDAEIFKATSRSTDTLTVTGAQDGTSAQNHGSSSIVVWAMSAGALTQFKTDCTGATAAFVLLEQETAAASATLDFTAISSTYDTYQFEFVNVLPATDGATLSMRVSTDGGATYVATASYSYMAWRFDAATAAAGGATGATSIILAETNGIGNAAAFGLVGMIQLYAPLSTTVHKAISGNIAFRNAAGTRIAHVVSGAYEDNGAINAVRFLASSGNLTSGIIRLYGLTKT